MKESLENYYVRNVVLLFFLLLFVTFSIIFYDNLYKILASLTFIVTGFMNYFRSDMGNKQFACMLLLGLICGFIGDIVILFDFQMGAICFLIGHILYFFSFCKKEPFLIKDFLPIVICIVVAIIIVTFVMPHETTVNMRIVILVYAVIISFMTGKAISLQILEKNKLSLILCIGSVAFFISDIAVLLSKFSITNKILFTNIGRCIYFPAQFILAQALSSIYDFTKFKHSKTGM